MIFSIFHRSVKFTTTKNSDFDNFTFYMCPLEHKRPFHSIFKRVGSWDSPSWLQLHNWSLLTRSRLPYSLICSIERWRNVAWVCLSPNVSEIIAIIIDNFSLIWRRHHYQWRAAPMLGNHGHWAVRVHSVPHLLWHGASVYTGHIWGSVSLTPIADR